GAIIHNSYSLNNGQGRVISVGPTSATVQSVDLSASTKTVDRASASPGDTLNYGITISNTGPVGSPGATITDTLTAGVTFVNGTATGGASYNGGLNAVVWHGALGSGAAHSISFKVKVTTSLGSGDTIDNSATLDTGFGNLSHTNTASTAVLMPDLST